MAISETLPTHQVSSIDWTKLNKVAKKRKPWKENACGNAKTLTRQRKELSDIKMQDLNGNWTQDEPKVPKKAKLINLRAYQCQSVSQIYGKSYKREMQAKFSTYIYIGMHTWSL